MRKCLFKYLHWAKHNPHTSHLKGFSPVWVCRWRFKLLFSVKHNPHKSHLKGFSPVWVRIWFLIFSLRENLNPHTSHLKGFSPVWVRKCLFISPLWENLNPHMSHLINFSSVWVRRWLFKLLLRAKHNPHTNLRRTGHISIKHIWRASPQYADDCSYAHFWKRINHKCHIWSVFHRCVVADVPLNFHCTNLAFKGPLRRKEFACVLVVQ